MPKARSMQERKAQIAVAIDPSMEAFSAARKYADDLVALNARVGDPTQVVTTRRGGRNASAPPIGSRVGGFNPGAVFDSPSDAALAVHQTYNSKSISDNLEHFWIYYQDAATGKYGYSDPVYGGLEGVDNFRLKPTVNGDPVRAASAIGMGHSHGNYSQRDGALTTKARDAYGSDRFSKDDDKYRRSPVASRMSYFSLGTPSGNFLERNRNGEAMIMVTPSLADLISGGSSPPTLSGVAPLIELGEK